VAGSERGTMTMVSDSVIKDLYFGFDMQNLLLRLDTQSKARLDLREFDEVRFKFVEPYGTEILASCNGDSTQPVIRIDDKPVLSTDGRFAIDQVFELAVPWHDLGVIVGQRLHVATELLKGGEVIERTPSEGTIDLQVPSADFEMHMWQA